jgi:hypothetical protein
MSVPFFIAYPCIEFESRPPAKLRAAHPPVQPPGRLTDPVAGAQVAASAARRLVLAGLEPAVRAARLDPLRMLRTN